MPGTTGTSRRSAETRRSILISPDNTSADSVQVWRRQREAGQLAGLAPQKRGRKVDETAAENSRLRQENERLERQLTQAELIIDAQKKLSEVLGLTLEQGRGKSK